MKTTFDIIVIGGGHAGTEAAWAAANVLGESARIALITMDPSRIGQMSCNPAIGGLAKGQIVREIDALGGIMGRAIDATGIMFKMLNMSKGAAVRGPRAQADKYAYAEEVQRLIAERPEIHVVAAAVDSIVTNDESSGDVCTGVRLADGRELSAGAVILTTGTFMRGLMHTGATKTEGGRVGEHAANAISTSLRELGFDLGRLKTGTPPRLDRATIDWESLEPQYGDDDPVPFSDLSPNVIPGGRFPAIKQIDCRITHTNAAMHDIIRENLHLAAMYSGATDAEAGPRYCPSIEDKVVRFEDRTSHHVFLEPESLRTNEVYANGISMSLPRELQEQLVRMMPGCGDATILTPGYAVEYDMVWPHQIDATCAAKHIDRFYLAGQINCTTGYEEAGAQGLIAGLNAARAIAGDDPYRFGRDQGYLGVMMDDLVTKTPREPYRMFTSRAEHRLLLRADNASTRLTGVGIELGLVRGERAAWFAMDERARDAINAAFKSVRVGPRTLGDVVLRQETTESDVRALLAEHGIGTGADDDAAVPARALRECMIDARYAGYIDRQRAEIRRSRELDRRSIPAWLRAGEVTGLRSEAAEVLTRFQPTTLGQASRLSGVNPADISLLSVAIRKGSAGAAEAGLKPGEESD